MSSNLRSDGNYQIQTFHLTRKRRIGSERTSSKNGNVEMMLQPDENDPLPPSSDDG